MQLFISNAHQKPKSASNFKHCRSTYHRHDFLFNVFVNKQPVVLGLVNHQNAVGHLFCSPTFERVALDIADDLSIGYRSIDNDQYR